MSRKFIQVNLRNFISDIQDPRSALLANAASVVSPWEENAHKNAALRWLRNHSETGHGVACSRLAAVLMAKKMAEMRVSVMEAMLVAGFTAENWLIDVSGQIWLESWAKSIMEGQQ